jgi:hypothetical protein
MALIRESVDGQARTVRLVFGEEELALVANALNEVCNGVEIEDFEFFTRLGADREEARELLAALGAALDELPPQT